MDGLVAIDEKLHNPNVPWADKRVRQALDYVIDGSSIFADEPFGASERVESWPRISDHITNFDQRQLRDSK